MPAKLAIEYGSLAVADISLAMVEDASKVPDAVPAADYGIGTWFRPLVARRRKAEETSTLTAHNRSPNRSHA
ncbi:hypothetical protein [Paraburkholderia sp. GAS334]|jgi:hypothetical protein|uniref:hypothetical protein n=1 Tax=Paraburkholderia sp. GAS334 TaxID=3035131 RepID=UPI003D21627F